jgi:hypothetical protein
VRRSKSSAILPLRKHLIEKTKQESAKKAMDEEQFYYQQQQQMASSRERLMIRPIEEVMEEETPSSTTGCPPFRQSADSMEVDSGVEPDASAASSQLFLHSTGSRSGSLGTESSGSAASAASLTVSSLPPSFAARVGTSGLSPLVLSEVGGSISSDYVTKLLPRQPLDLGMASAAAAVSAVPPMDRTGLGYDPQMLRHHCACGSDAIHPENPSRVLAIWTRLVEAGLADRCARVARRATLEEIRSCHAETHTLVYGTDMVNRTGNVGKFCRLECGGVGVDSDTYWNEVETPTAVRTAVGTLVELAQRVSQSIAREFSETGPNASFSWPLYFVISPAISYGKVRCFLQVPFDKSKNEKTKKATTMPGFCNSDVFPM